MATPKDVLKGAIGDDTTIKTLIANAFLTRNLLHLAHWSTKSYAAHNALGDLYDSIIDDIDEIVEVYQGKYGLLSNLSVAGAVVPSDICAHVKDEANWVEANRSSIARGCSAIENLIDNLVASYQKTIYKLTNLS
jgi:DNA-binding ferritin-like protein